MTVPIAIGSTVTITLLVADLLLNRLTVRTLFALLDRLPPYRSGGRYKSQSTPEKYASLRRPRKGS